MPRIPPEEIERLKKEIPVQRLAEAAGVKLKRHGKDLIGLCVFHDDKKPSLVISPGKNLWNCLGACGAGGTVIDWVMKAEGVSFRHAVELLRNDPEAVGKSTHSYQSVKSSRARKLDMPFTTDLADQELMKQIVHFYHETLKQSPEALAYLEKRGLKNSEMIDRFQLGYSNRTLCYRLPERGWATGAAIRAQLSNLGILRKSGHEHFTGSIVFPIFDDQGQVAGMYGRKIVDDQADVLLYHMYLPGPHKGVWNSEALSASKDVILCEALIDALTFWCAGFKNVTASYGVNGFIADHLAAFKKSGIQRVFIAYDRDKAGIKAADKLADELIVEGFECFRVLFPRNMDANEYALRVKPPEKSLDLLIRSAVWMGRPQEPKTATKGKNVEEIPGQETGVQPEKSPDQFFHLAAEKGLKQPPTPAPEPPRPEEMPIPKPEPARPAPVLRSTVPDSNTEIRPEEIIIRLNDRRWRIRGMVKNMAYDQLKVNILVSQGEKFFVDTFDLYTARCRAVYTKQAAEELRVSEDIIKLELGRVLLKLEEIQDKQIKETLEPKEKEIVLTPEETAEALELLKDPRLLSRILSDFEKCGIVGEETNKLVGYLAAVSRKLEKPLAIIIQSSSSAGKTLLMDSILAFMPEEERVKYSAMTGQSLFYMGEKNLKHKILAIVEEEGAERASYALKLLQSEGELSIASTGKDPTTGRLVTHEYKVQGPVMIFITTTNVDIDEELQNRCTMLSVDESREQTRAIHQIQRESRSLEGFLRRSEKPKLLKLHQNAQRLLKTIPVLNTYSRFLTFMDDKTRLRRDQEKYLNLIEALALIHQYQRPLKTIERWGETGGGQPVQCLEVSLDDIELANRLAHEVLGRSLDELSPQTRRFLLLLDELIKKECEEKKMARGEYRFFRSDLIQKIGWSYDQVRFHLDRLTEREYIIAHFGARGQRFTYELIYDGNGKDGKPFLPGLIDVEALRKKYPLSATSTLGCFQESLGIFKEGLGGPLGVHWDRVGTGLGSQETPDGKSVSEEKTKISEKNARLGIPPQNPIHSNTGHTQTLSLTAKKGKDKGNGSEKLLHEEKQP